MFYFLTDFEMYTIFWMSFFTKFSFLKNAVANEPVPVTAESTDIFNNTTKETYWRYSYIYFDTPDLSNDTFFMQKIEKIIVSERFFNFDIYLFSTGTTTTNKLDDSIPIAHFYNLKYRNKFVDSIPITYFSRLQVPVVKPQTKLMTEYR